MPKRAAPGTVLAKSAHHRGTYVVESAKVRKAANASPATVCWRCGRTLAQHPRHKTGRRPHWQAGHVNTSEIGGRLVPEASTCNTEHGARIGHQRMRTATRGRTRTTQLNTSRTW